MKIRQGFVSNSSSSSFIIKDKTKWDKAKELLNHGDDYFIFKDTLYTSMIYGDSALWSDLYELNDKNEELRFEGDSYSPYGGDEFFVEVDGKLGNESVWLPRDEFSDEDYLKLGKVPLCLAQQLYRYVTNNIDKVDKDTFINECKKIIDFDSEYEYEE